MLNAPSSRYQAYAGATAILRLATICRSAAAPCTNSASGATQTAANYRRYLDGEVDDPHVARCRRDRVATGQRGGDGAPGILRHSQEGERHQDAANGPSGQAAREP